MDQLRFGRRVLILEELLLVHNFHLSFGRF
jgi:hypothetical protein